MLCKLFTCLFFYLNKYNDHGLNQQIMFYLSLFVLCLCQNYVVKHDWQNSNLLGNATGYSTSFQVIFNFYCCQVKIISSILLHLLIYIVDFLTLYSLIKQFSTGQWHAYIFPKLNRNSTATTNINTTIYNITNFFFVVLVMVLGT